MVTEPNQLDIGILRILEEAGQENLSSLINTVIMEYSMPFSLESVDVVKGRLIYLESVGMLKFSCHKSSCSAEQAFRFLNWDANIKSLVVDGLDQVTDWPTAVILEDGIIHSLS